MKPARAKKLARATGTTAALLFLLLCASAALAQPELQGPTARETIRDAAQGLKEAVAYSFVVRPDVDTADRMMSRFPRNVARDIEGVVDNGSSVMHFKTGSYEIVRKGKQLVVGVGGRWEKVEDFRRREFRRRESLYLRKAIMHAAARRAPHEEVANHLRRAGELKERETKDVFEGRDVTIYEGPLTEQGTLEVLLGPLGSFADRLGAQVEEPAGKIAFWVTDDRLLVKVEIEARGKMKVPVGNAEETFDLVTGLVTEIRDINSASLGLPEQAKDVLGSGPGEAEIE